jgi:hypothetical protein
MLQQFERQCNQSSLRSQVKGEILASILLRTCGGDNSVFNEHLVRLQHLRQPRHVCTRAIQIKEAVTKLKTMRANRLILLYIASTTSNASSFAMTNSDLNCDISVRNWANSDGKSMGWGG